MSDAVLTGTLPASPDALSGAGARDGRGRAGISGAATLSAAGALPAPLPATGESDSPQAWRDAGQVSDSEFIEAKPPHW
jgi:hypothetical protein